MWKTFATLILSLALGAGVGFAEPLGALYPAGLVEINGQAVAPGLSSPVAVGDTITTGGDGSARLALANGGSVTLRPETSIRAGDNVITLEFGAVESTQEVFLSGARQGWSFSSSGGGSDYFTVASRGERLLVAALSGDVILEQPDAPATTTPEGSFVTATADASPVTAQLSAIDAPAYNVPLELRKDLLPQKLALGPPPSPPDTSAIGAAEGGSSGSGSGGWTIGSLSHGQSVALVGAIAAGAAGGTVAAVTLSDEDEPARSPSN